MIQFIAGMVVGINLGIVILGLCVVARREDDRCEARANNLNKGF